MAPAVLPVLGGVTLPAPASQDDTILFRGGSLQMASGKIIHDLVDAQSRHRFSLRWVYLTAAQATTVRNAWEVVKNTTASYTSVLGNTYTVTRPDGGELDVQLVVTAGGDIKYHLSMELLEDS